MGMEGNMQRLTLMTLGALAVGLAGHAHDASAQTSASKASACPAYESTVYFAPDSTELNTFSDYTIVRIAEEARACGAKGIVVQAAADGARAQSVASALRSRGIKAVVIPWPALALSGETIVARSVTLRVAEPTARFS